jgi:hypothetical protein
MGERQGARAERCLICAGWITWTRITLPRKITGDLTFCRYACVQVYWERQQPARPERRTRTWSATMSPPRPTVP